MIDSVVLQLSEDLFTIKNELVFDGYKKQSGKGYSTSRQYIKSLRDKEIKSERYFPMIDLHKVRSGSKWLNDTLEIQVSLPKLLYGTNLFEIDKNDYSKIRDKLIQALDKVNIILSQDFLEKTIVKRADFSKVIKISKYFGRAEDIIYKLSRFNYKPCSDFKLVNKDCLDGIDGMYIKFYNTSQGYVIYDKFAEIDRQGYTSVEKSLMNISNNKKMKNNVIRFELSLQKKQTFNSVIGKRKEVKKKNYNLEDIMDIVLIKGLMLEYFNKVFNSVSIGLVSLAEMKENELLSYLEASGISQLKIESMYYWVNMTTKFGIKGVWKKISDSYSGGGIARKKKEIALVMMELGEIPTDTPNLVNYLRDEHKEFKIIRPS